MALDRTFSFHIARMTEKQSKGKLDPSPWPWLARGDAGSGVAGHDDPADLRDFVGAGDWRCVAVGVVQRNGRPDCNSAVPDHIPGRSKTPYDICFDGKSVGEEAFRHESPAQSSRRRM